MNDNRSTGKAGKRIRITKKKHVPSLTYPMMLLAPLREITESCWFNETSPLPFDWRFPRSPTWRTLSLGAPWVWSNGLKWGPAEVHPLVRSPHWLNKLVSRQIVYTWKWGWAYWTWKPRLALGGRPLIFPISVTGPFLADWTKTMVPSTLEPSSGNKIAVA